MSWVLEFSFIVLFTLFSIPKTLGQDDGWHLDTTYLLVNERLDPIINPNGVSAHMHKVIGGSMFGANYNYDDYSNAKCSSLALQADKSNYWMPCEFLFFPYARWLTWGSTLSP